MYNASHYSEQTQNIYEILGSYVVDAFYNRVYDRAREYHTIGRQTSITEAYKDMCRAYVNNFTKPEHFRAVLRKLSEYFNEVNTIIPVTSYSDWVDTVTREFTPPEYFASLSSQQKDSVLSKVVDTLHRRFAVEVAVTPASLQMIIDNHEEPNNIEVFQDKMKTICFEEREKMFAAFSGQANSDKQLLDRLRRDLTSETQKRQLLTGALRQAKSQIDILGHEKATLITKCRELITALSATTRAAPQPQSYAAPPAPTRAPPKSALAKSPPPQKKVEFKAPDDDPSDDLFDDIEATAALDSIEVEDDGPEDVDAMRAAAHKKRMERAKSNENVAVDAVF